MEEQTLQQTDLQGARQASLADPGPPILPGYQLSRRLGQGSFGQVWAGIQESTGQAVAIKILQLASRDLGREVERLRQVSQHPYVVTLLDANLEHTPSFLVMPLLARSLAHAQPPLDQVITWLEQAATALQYVHGRGLLHCDLKPANLLIDDNQAVRVADFGQALLQDDGEQRLGTLFYMPPEQAVLDGPVVAAVSWDIYALGATFYQLLTGRLPRAQAALQEQLSHLSSSRELLAHYSQQLPQQVLQPIRALNPRVDGDLAAIVEHCLEIEPQRRYPDMGGLLADLQRRSGLLPLSCRASTPSYRILRFVQRNRAAVAVALVAFLLLGVAFHRVLEERSKALEQARAARETSAQFAFLSAASLEGSEALLRVAQAVEQSDGPSAGMRRRALHLYLQVHPKLLEKYSFQGDFHDLELADEPGNGAIDVTRGLLLGHEINGSRAALFSWKTGRLDWLGWQQKFLQGQLGGADVALDDGGKVRWGDQPVAVTQANWLRLDPGGRLLAVGEAETEDAPEQTLHLFWPRLVGHSRLSLPSMSVRQAEFSADGRLLAHVGVDGRLHVFQLKPPRLLWSRPMDVEQVAFSPDHRSLWLRHRFALERVDRASGRPLKRLPLEAVTACLSSQEKGLFFSATHDRGGQLGQWASDSASPETIVCPALAQSMAWDGRRLAVGFSDGKVRLYGGDIHTPEGIMQCGEGVRWLAFEGDELLAFAGADDRPRRGMLWRWKLRADAQGALPEGSEIQLLPAGALAWNESQLTVTPYTGPSIRLEAPLKHCLWVDDQLLVLAFQDGRVRRVRPGDGSTLGEIRLPVPAQALRPDGKAALICNPEGREWREVSLQSGAVLRVHPRTQDVLERPVYSANGRVAMAFRPVDTVCLVLFSQQPIEFLPGSPPRLLVLSPGGERFWLVTWLEPGYASTVFTGVTAGTGDPDRLARLTHANMVSSVALAPDGATVVTASSDGTAAVWPAELAEGTVARPLLILRHEVPLLGAGFSPDGKLIATQSIHGQVRLWEVATGLPIGPALPNTPGVDPCFTSPQQLVTVVQSRLRLWDLSPAPIEGAVARARQHTGLSP